MQVAPNSTIILYSGMPLDNTYSDTLYFTPDASGKAQQTAWFTVANPYEKRRFGANTYQRVNSGVFEAQCLADTVYDCNYMAFQNTNFGNKWFYAFITSVEYVNNGCTRITYEIDVMQTYWFEAELEWCFVEREHSDVDTVGANILPEPLSIGEYVFENYTPMTELYDSIIIVAEALVSGSSADGQIYDNVYSGVKLKAFNNTTAGVQAINAEIGQYIQQPDTIVNMYMCPKYLFPDATDSGVDIGYKETGRYTNIPFNSAESNVSPSGKYLLGSYAVKNNKLLTYPYNFFHVDDGNGSSLSLRYEFFDSHIPRLALTGCISNPVQVTCRPTGYKGTTPPGGLSQGQQLMTESLGISGFPLCSWNYDTYKAWVAQNTVPLILNGISAVAGVGATIANTNVSAQFAKYPQGVMKTGAIGVGTSLLGNVISTMNTIYQASIQADTCKGNINSGNANFARKNLTFFTAQAHLNEQELRCIDDFFNRFGYACNRTKLPNRYLRPHWNYVKTNGCTIIGKCPSDAIARICQIYDGGITFWHNANEIGNYSLDNSPSASSGN